MPDDTRDLRKEVERLRRAANIRTVGGHEAETHLFALAHKLERQADQKDRNEAAKPPW